MLINVLGRLCYSGNLTTSCFKQCKHKVNYSFRHYKNVPNLPARLQPECMVRHHGLKACVVRSLFYMYPPLVARVDSQNMATPYDLKSRQCISMWQEVSLVHYISVMFLVLENGALQLKTCKVLRGSFL